MNYPSPGLALSQAITGFLQFKTAEACSPRTLAGYRDRLRDWLAYRGDGDVATVTTESLRAYLAYLRTDYKPRRFSRKPQPLAPKTLRNIYITLSSFFNWLARLSPATFRKASATTHAHARQNHTRSSGRARDKPRPSWPWHCGRQ
jgi:site-specific recombinase XerD